MAVLQPALGRNGSAQVFLQACHPLPDLGVGARVRRWTGAVAIDRNDYSGPNDRDSRSHLSMFASEIPARKDLYVASEVHVDEAAATAGFDVADIGGKSLAVTVRPHEIRDQVLAEGLFHLRTALSPQAPRLYS